MEVPHPDLAAEAPAGDDVTEAGVEGDAPGGAGMPLECLDALPRPHVGHVDVVVPVGAGHQLLVGAEHDEEA